MPERVSAGMPVKKSPFREAAFVNDVIAMLTWFKRYIRGGQVPASRRHSQTSSGIISLKNTTGANRPLGTVLRLDTPTLDELDRDHIWFGGVVCTTTYFRKHAILLEPIAYNDIGPAQMSGVCLALVNVGNILHTHCRTPNNAYSLVSDMLGPIEILSPITSTGEQLLAVNLSSACWNKRGKADAAIAKGASGTVSVYNGPGSSAADSTVNVTAYSPYGAITSGKWVELTLVENASEIVATEC